MTDPAGEPAVETLAAWQPQDPLTVLRGVGPKVAARLGAVGLRTIGELLMCFPRRHADVTDVPAPGDGSLHRLVRVRARVTGTRIAWLPRRRSVVTVGLEAVADGTPFEVRFFNQPYSRHAYPAGDERWVEGVVEKRGGAFRLAGRILPRGHAVFGPCVLSYADVPGISAARFAGLVDQALRRVDFGSWRHAELPEGLADRLAERLPDSQADPRADGLADPRADRLADPRADRAAGGLPAFADAVRAMHQPGSREAHERARLRFAVGEAARLFRRVERARRARAGRAGPEILIDGRVAARIRARLPFELTADQDRAMRRLIAWLAGPAPMGVLLQGDVGTGKTAVAVGAALAVIAAGYQVAFLAPTELLAEQHFAGVRPWLAGSGVATGLMTSSLAPAARAELDAALRDGRPHLVFGTHALFSDRTRFARLGLAIIDEQHRFGVEQRTRLVRKGRDPHVLYLTATPIPRTLTLTVFGDLDVAVLRQRPPGHRAVPAFFVPSDAGGWRRIRASMQRRVARGQQVFVVCPKIGADRSKGGVVRMYEELSRHFACEVVHGRMPAAERQATVEAFRGSRFDVLIGTTVLEVGVDVPNAALMVVVGADRFGMATLHQLRGRVGRGRRRGVCIVTGAPGSRVEAICATTDGFELAERDLELRGAGELLGTTQSGLSDLRALDPVRDVALLGAVREAVRDEPVRDEPARGEPARGEPARGEPARAEAVRRAVGPGYDATSRNGVAE